MKSSRVKKGEIVQPSGLMMLINKGKGLEREISPNPVPIVYKASRLKAKGREDLEGNEAVGWVMSQEAAKEDTDLKLESKESGEIQKGVC